MTNGGDMFSAWPTVPAKPDAEDGQRPANVFPFPHAPAEQPSMSWLTNPAQTAPQGWDEPEPERDFPSDFPAREAAAGEIAPADVNATANCVGTEQATEDHAEGERADDPLLSNYRVVGFELEFDIDIDGNPELEVSSRYDWTGQLDEWMDAEELDKKQKFAAEERLGRLDRLVGEHVLAPVVRHLSNRGFIMANPKEDDDKEECGSLVGHSRARRERDYSICFYALVQWNQPYTDDLNEIRSLDFQLEHGLPKPLRRVSVYTCYRKDDEISAAALYRGFGPEYFRSSWIRQKNSWLSTAIDLGDGDPDAPLSPAERMQQALWPLNGDGTCEPPEEWAARVALREQDIKTRAHVLRITGGDFGLYDGVMGTSETQKGVEWVVEGFAARGVITLFVGQQGIGKSTLLHELCFKVGRLGPGTADFLGVPVAGERIAVMAFGEDPDGFIHDRTTAFRAAFGESIVIKISDSKPLDELIRQIDSMPTVDLVVIDPVRTYLPGGEADNDAVNRFFEPLSALAARKNCAIITSHHIAKAHTPAHIRSVIPRGAQVFMDRPRLIFGMVRLRERIVGIGMIKNNFPPSSRPWGDLFEQRLFVQDEATLSLLPLAGQAQAKAAPAAKSEQSADVAAVAGALRQLTDAGEVVHRTGASELFNRQCAELAGWSRARVRKAVQAAIDTGIVTNPDDGSGIHLNNSNAAI
ncbi:AAA family ATPase [Novosphingobium sp. PASSN1]|uniref:AAA family ATPase n=1 Tax=Novosphingobium sp. PASSN1 TaxID=2015561 RepID=UPI000BDA5ABA|nr:AAA family ATPase [Novosphingobium sp. PASSN1]OYU34697.1 MAG: hypothetical protein CFE35_12450 [Novosphingobium sp. PASSN1]